MRRLALVAGTLVIVVGVMLLVRPRDGSVAPPPPPVVGHRLFDEVFARVRASLVDPLDDEELYRRAALGVIGELDDPYAYLELPGEPALPAADAPLPQGLFLDRREGRAVVVAALPGSPAAAAGLRPGDVLVSVDTALINANRLQTAARLLAGSPGSRVTVRVRRDGNLLARDLVRGPLPSLAPLEFTDLGGGVARVRLNRIGPGTADSLQRTILAREGQGIRSLVLDLRSTAQGGSDLSAGVRLADLFLDRGTVLAVSRMRHASGNQSLTDSTPSPFAAMPLAVLIDGGTAGAAELLAGTLQDHDRAIVLGQESYGRGATWSRFSLGDGAVLTLTTALWLTPNGRQIQRPLTPDSAAAGDAERPRVRSDAGRMLTGGGGIVPDRVIREGSDDVVLAEARRILMRATRPEAVFALAGPR